MNPELTAAFVFDDKATLLILRNQIASEFGRSTVEMSYRVNPILIVQHKVAVHTYVSITSQNADCIIHERDPANFLIGKPIDSHAGVEVEVTDRSRSFNANRAVAPHPDTNATNSLPLTSDDFVAGEFEDDRAAGFNYDSVPAID